MSLIAAAAAQQTQTTSTSTTTTTSLEPIPIPYSFPETAPYHAPQYALTPSPDGTGSAVHPSVIDFGVSGWNGWRYWMAMTPYYGNNDRVENPCILVSQNGYDWRVPSGLTNPVYPAPPAPRFNSDTDLEYDPTTDRLILLYRELLADSTQQSFIAASSNGVSWPSTAQALNWTRPYGGTGQLLSPALIRRAENDWWIFGIGRDDLHMFYYRATDPFGIWVGPTSMGPINLGTNKFAWHLDVIWDGTVFRALVDLGPFYLGRPDGIRAGTIAADASSMIWAATDVLPRPMTGWDTTQLYRATLFPHENGTHFKVWYSAEGIYSYRTGYTQIPKSEWPNIGDTITFPTDPPDPANPKTPEQPWNPTTFEQAVKDLGAEGYWKLDETSETIMADSSGNNRHGVVAGILNTDFAYGGSNGLTFLTTQGSVQIKDSQVWRPTGGMSVFAAIKSTSALTSGRHLVSKRVGTQQVGEWVFGTFLASLTGGYQNPTGSGWHSYSESGANTLPIGPTLGGSWVGASMSKPASAPPVFYINNNTPLQSGGGGTQASASTYAPISIGTGFIGQIRHVAIFMRELTASEISVLMALASAEGIITSSSTTTTTT